MGEAFDRAWLEITDHFAGDEKQIDRARTRLAHAVLIVADDDCLEVERIKNEALQILAQRSSASRNVCAEAGLRCLSTKLAGRR